mmetsp:Transcript_69088/g.179489  ORF Transcript_69088/g.179489 Transcript_69088/m.179489 type:complete len:299 (-) Transcript_69088:22-918(-)
MASTSPGAAGSQRKRKTPDGEGIASTLAESLTCPVCLELIPPPIFQCKRGHVFCGECLDKLEAGDKQCPTCRTQLPSERIRSLLGDQIASSLEYPCPNSYFGCTAKMLLDARGEHLLVCMHRPAKCPSGSCSWRGRSEDVLLHMQGHGAVVLESKEFKASKPHLSFSRGLYFSNSGFFGSYQVLVWTWSNSTFVLYRCPLDHRRQLRFTLYVAGQVQGTSPAEFDYRLKLVNKTTRRSVEHTGPVVSMHSPDLATSAADACCYLSVEDALQFGQAADQPLDPHDTQSLWPDFCIRVRQ